MMLNALDQADPENANQQPQYARKNSVHKIVCLHMELTSLQHQLNLRH
jgi:hypothetical protein